MPFLGQTYSQLNLFMSQLMNGTAAFMESGIKFEWSVVRMADSPARTTSPNRGLFLAEESCSSSPLSFKLSHTERHKTFQFFIQHNHTPLKDVIVFKFCCQVNFAAGGSTHRRFRFENSLMRSSRELLKQLLRSRHDEDVSCVSKTYHFEKAYSRSVKYSRFA